MQDIELTDRELFIAKQAAKLAVEELEKRFYEQVGKTIITKILVWIGIAACAFAAGKGWISKL